MDFLAATVVGYVERTARTVGCSPLHTVDYGPFGPKDHRLLITAPN